MLRSEGPGAGFEISSTGINKLYVNSTAANPLDPQELAIGYQGVNSGGVLTSRDGGATWLRESCPATRYIRAVFSPAGVLHAISSGPTTVAAEGVYRRESGRRLGPSRARSGVALRHRPQIAAIQHQRSAAPLRRRRRQQHRRPRGRDLEIDRRWRLVDEDLRERSSSIGWSSTWRSSRTAPTPRCSLPGSPTTRRRGGVLRSIDGGRTWDEPVQGLPAGAVPVALSPSPRGPEVFFLADVRRSGRPVRHRRRRSDLDTHRFRGVPGVGRRFPSDPGGQGLHRHRRRSVGRGFGRRRRSLQSLRRGPGFGRLPHGAGPFTGHAAAASAEHHRWELLPDPGQPAIRADREAGSRRRHRALCSADVSPAQRPRTIDN